MENKKSDLQIMQEKLIILKKLSEELDLEYDRLDNQSQFSDYSIEKKIFPKNFEYKGSKILLKSFDELNTLIYETKNAIDFLLEYEKSRKESNPRLF